MRTVFQRRCRITAGDKEILLIWRGNTGKSRYDAVTAAPLRYACTARPREYIIVILRGNFIFHDGTLGRRQKIWQQRNGRARKTSASLSALAARFLRRRHLLTAIAGFHLANELVMRELFKSFRRLQEAIGHDHTSLHARHFLQ